MQNPKNEGCERAYSKNFFNKSFNKITLRFYKITLYFFQVTQLDMTMKEHRSEMEQRCIQLEGGFKKSQFELQQKSKQVHNQK